MMSDEFLKMSSKYLANIRQKLYDLPGIKNDFPKYSAKFCNLDIFCSTLEYSSKRYIF